MYICFSLVFSIYAYEMEPKLKDMFIVKMRFKLINPIKSSLLIVPHFLIFMTYICTRKGGANKDIILIRLQINTIIKKKNYTNIRFVEKD